jgi:hypothetical protein
MYQQKMLKYKKKYLLLKKTQKGGSLTNNNFKIPDKSILKYLRDTNITNKLIRETTDNYLINYGELISAFENGGILPEVKAKLNNNHENINFFTNKDGIILYVDYENINTFKKFFITKNDLVVPICHEGQNRSQVLYLVLNCIKSLLTTDNKKYKVTYPHGANGGFDPFIAYENLNSDNWIEFMGGNHINDIRMEIFDDARYRTFIQAFGIPKSIKLGETECKDDLTPPTLEEGNIEVYSEVSKKRSEQRLIMNNLLFNVPNLLAQKGEKGFVYLFSLGESYKIILNRLRENGNTNFDKIIIVILNFNDPINFDKPKSSEIQRKLGIAEEIYGKYDDITLIEIYKEMFKTYSDLFIPTILTDDMDIGIGAGAGAGAGIL